MKFPPFPKIKIPATSHQIPREYSIGPQSGEGKWEKEKIAPRDVIFSAQLTQCGVTWWPGWCRQRIKKKFNFGVLVARSSRALRYVHWFQFPPRPGTAVTCNSILLPRSPGLPDVPCRPISYSFIHLSQNQPRKRGELFSAKWQIWKTSFLLFCVAACCHLIKKAILEIQKRLRRDDPDLFTKYAKYDSWWFRPFLLFPIEQRIAGSNLPPAVHNCYSNLFFIFAVTEINDHIWLY